MLPALGVTVVALAILTNAGRAEARGCIKGAASGAVAGHVAGHHAVIGAVAGCAVGHHLAKKEQLQQRQLRQQQALSAPRDATTR
jgi:hypothetical protein